MMRHLYPIISSNGRLVCLSSMISQRTFYNLKNCEIGFELSQNQIHLTLERVEELARRFIDEFKTNEAGWPRSAYGMSKLLVNALTRIYGYADLLTNLNEKRYHFNTQSKY